MVPPQYVVQSGATSRNWVKDEYSRGRLLIRQLSAEAKSRIHISFDLWTSPNGYALCGICAHFVEKKGSNCSVLIGMKRMKGSHGGENIAEVVIPVLIDYQIAPRLGVFVADNADLNDAAIRSILHELRPELSIDDRRSRCLGHTINLAAKAFIFGKETDAFKALVDSVDETDALDSDKMRWARAAWRERGPIGKFHNMVTFIRSSPQRREAFKRSIVGGDSSNGKCLLYLG